MSQFSEKFKWLGKRLVSYFFQGLLLIAPASFTAYVIYVSFDFLNRNTRPIFERLFHFSLPGLGILVFAGFITLLGFIGSTVLVKPILNVIENLLEHTPLVKDIYTSVKDFISAFISNKRKFNKPVIVEMGKGVGIYRLGFITDADLAKFHVQDMVAVYLPLSYTFSGQLYLVNREQVKALPPNMSADTIKYILSGGVMELEEKDA
jgi:uncharacterized membrane protein